MRVAGTGSPGSTPDKLNQPRCLYFDASNALYICDFANNRIQKWILGTPNGTTVAGNSSGTMGVDARGLDNPTDIAFDKFNNIYVADYNNHRVQRFAPNSLVGTTVAGIGTSGAQTHKVDLPTAVAVDNNLNLYVTENGNNRLVVWPPNATNGTILINGAAGGTASGEITNPYSILLVNSASNQIYLSDASKDRVQLWTFGTALANRTYITANAVNMNTPRQILLDPYGNIYVADSARNRVVLFCLNSTTGFVVVGSGTSSTPTLSSPSGIAFDSNFNLYVASTNGDEVLRYTRI